jgi:hypothetical protein
MQTKTNIVGPHFLIERPRQDGFGFSFVSADRTLVFRGVSYASVDAMTAGIEAVRARILAADWPRRFQTPDGTTYYFEIAYPDGTLLATSVHYGSRFAREVAIEMVQLDAGTAPIRRHE